MIIYGCIRYSSHKDYVEVLYFLLIKTNLCYIRRGQK